MRSRKTHTAKRNGKENILALGALALNCFVVFFKDFVYLFMRDTGRGRDIGRRRSRLHAGSPMWDSLPGPRKDTPSQRQMLNH